MASHWSKYPLLLGAIFCTFQMVCSIVVIEIKFNSYSDDCTEDFIKTKCDPKFKFCLGRPDITSKISVCYYATTSESGHYQNTNHINFGGNIKGIANPWRILTNRLMDPSIRLITQVRDDDLVGPDDHLQTWETTLQETVYPSKSAATWTSKTSISASHTLTFQVRIYCDVNYYNSDCTNYCLAIDNSNGHYSCNQTTGAKICMQGWTGSNCREDINECSLNYCERGRCDNLQADYICHCPLHYTGKNCTVKESPCDSNPCKKGATCTNIQDFSYNCTCVGEWEGQICNIKLNPCKAAPCQNGAECIPSADHTNYSCQCVYPYIGVHCDIISSTTSMYSPATTTITEEGAKIIQPSESSKAGSANASIENKAGIAAGRIKAEEEAANYTNEAGMQHWHGILIATLLIALIVIIIICLVVRRQKRKNKMSNDNTVVVYNNNNKSAFENNVYNDVNSSPLEASKRQRQHLPLPNTPLCVENEQLMPLKPVFTPSNMDAQGAEGGAYTELEIDMDADGYMKPSNFNKNKMDKKMIDKPFEREQMETNHYIDFKRLNSRLEESDSVEEVHYQDLDEIAITVNGLNTATKDKPLKSQADGCLKVTGPVGQSDAPAGNKDDNSTYNDTPSNIPVGFGYYENVHKTSFSVEMSDDSFVPMAKAKGKAPSKQEAVEHPFTSNSDHCGDAEVDVPSSGSPHAIERSNDDDEILNQGLPQVLPSTEGDYSTPRRYINQDFEVQIDSQECQYDIPPSSLPSNRSLKNGYRETLRLIECSTTDHSANKNPSTMSALLVRSSCNKNHPNGVDIGEHNRDNGLILPSAVPQRFRADLPINSSRTDSNTDDYTLPISTKGCTSERNDEKINNKEGGTSIKEGIITNSSLNINFGNYGSSKT